LKTAGSGIFLCSLISERTLFFWKILFASVKKGCENEYKEQ